MLDEANSLHPNIKLVRQLGISGSFLDFSVKNKNGVFTTSVHCKEAVELYIAPFKSDYPRHVFANIMDGALMRANVIHLHYQRSMKNDVQLN